MRHSWPSLPAWSSGAAASTPAFELAISLLDIREAVDFSDRDLETARLDQLRQTCEDLRGRALRVAVGLDAVLLGGREVDDGVDPIGHDSHDRW
jgi:hypothetical protein